MKWLLVILLLALASSTLQGMALGFVRSIGYTIMLVALLTWLR